MSLFGLSERYLMTTEELIACWKSVDVDGDRIQRIYAMVLNGVDKEKAHLQSEDESKAWDVIADDVNKNPPPGESIVEIPNV